MLNAKKHWIIIISIILAILLFFLFRRRKKSVYDNFFGEYGDGYIEESFNNDTIDEQWEDTIINLGKEKFKPKIIQNSTVEAKDVGKCSNNDFIQLNFKNDGTTPIEVGINGTNSYDDNQQVGYYELPNINSNTAYGDISPFDWLYVPKGNGLGTVAAVDTNSGNIVNIPISFTSGAANEFGFFTINGNRFIYGKSSGSPNNIVAIDANPLSPTFNTEVAVFSFAAQIIYKGYDGNILAIQGGGGWIYADSLTGTTLTSSGSISSINVNDIIATSDEGVNYFTITDGIATQIWEIDANPESITYLQFNLIDTLLGSYVNPYWMDGFLVIRREITTELIKYDISSTSIVATVSISQSGDLSSSYVQFEGLLIYADSFNLLKIDKSSFVIVDSILLNPSPFEPADIIKNNENYLYIGSAQPTNNMLVYDLNKSQFVQFENSINTIESNGPALFINSLGRLVYIKNNAIGGAYQIIQTPTVSLNNQQKIQQANWNPIKVCAIKYICKTEAQLSNPLVLINEGVNGISDEYRLTLIDRKTTSSVFNIIYVELKKTLILYSDQSLRHTINPGEDVNIFFYQDKQVVASMKKGKFEAKEDTGLGNNLSLTSEKGVNFDPVIDETDIEEMEFEEIHLELEGCDPLEDGIVVESIEIDESDLEDGILEVED